MKIINLSLAGFSNESDPLAWIGKSAFFKGIWSAVAMHEQVLFVEFIRYNGKIKIDGVDYWFYFKTRNQLKFPVAVFRSLRKEKAAVIIVHGLHFPWQVLLLKLIIGKNTRIIVQHHGERPFSHFLKRRLQKLADKCIDAYFFTSKGQAQAWQSIIKDERKVKEVMEVSSSFNHIPRSEARAFTKVQGRHTYIWVGHLDAHKDPLTAIKAFTQFVESRNEVYLYMVFQSENLLPAITAYLEHHPAARAAIKLVGKVPHESLLYWYNSVDFIIATSHREAGGVSVCEAMSCGCIPVLSNIPSFIAMTGNECGYIFEKGDTHSLYNTLAKTLLSEMVTEKERVLKRFRQKLSFDAVAQNIREILHDL